MEKRLKVFLTTCPNQLNVEWDKWAAKLLHLPLPLSVVACADAAAAFTVFENHPKKYNFYYNICQLSSSRHSNFLVFCFLFD